MSVSDAGEITSAHLTDSNTITALHTQPLLTPALSQKMFYHVQALPIAKGVLWYQTKTDKSLMYLRSKATLTL